MGAGSRTFSIKAVSVLRRRCGSVYPGKMKDTERTRQHELSIKEYTCDGSLTCSMRDRYRDYRTLEIDRPGKQMVKKKEKMEEIESVEQSRSTTKSEYSDREDGGSRISSESENSWPRESRVTRRRIGFKRFRCFARTSLFDVSSAGQTMRGKWSHF